MYMLRGKCQCGRLLLPIEAGESAVVIALRTCRKCHARWRVQVTPIRAPLRSGEIKYRAGEFIHRLDLECVKGAA